MRNKKFQITYNISNVSTKNREKFIKDFSEKFNQILNGLIVEPCIYRNLDEQPRPYMPSAETIYLSQYQIKSCDMIKVLSTTYTDSELVVLIEYNMEVASNCFFPTAISKSFDIQPPEELHYNRSINMMNDLIQQESQRFINTYNDETTADESACLDPNSFNI